MNDRSADRVRAGPSSDAADRLALGRMATGDLDALEELYDRYRTIAYSIALRMTGDTGLAQDVVQDAFLGVWRNARHYLESRGSVRTWLLSIVHHRAVDALRRRRPTVELPGPDVSPATLTAPDIWPEVAGRLDAELVRTALRSLPVAQRQAIELAYFDGLTQQEIASRTDVPLGTVKSRIRLGLIGLRRAILGDTDAAEPADLVGEPHGVDR